MDTPELFSGESGVRKKVIGAGLGDAGKRSPHLLEARPTVA